MKLLMLAIALAGTIGLPSAATAQSARTEQGVAAFVQGDYARAVEILKPAAERWQLPFDNTAAFFMALMYDNGLGVAPDPLKACALFLRMSAWQENTAPALIFAVQALVDDFNSRLGPQMGQCMLLADIGFNRTAQQATFTLAAGHWISIEISPERRAAMAHIEYQGKQNDLELGLPNDADVRYLPFTLTELTSFRPRPEPRHFLEAFVFMPTQASQWTLMWFVFEVVREGLVPVTVVPDLQTVKGDQPPEYELTDLRRLATIRLNANGDAEWVVLADAQRLTDVIETQAEREEIAAERLARQAAEKEVDSTLRRQPGRPPSLAYADSSSEGCMGPFVYGSSRDRTEGIMLHLGPQAFEGASPSTLTVGRTLGFEVRVHVYGAPQQRFPFCSDVRMLGDEGEVWQAIAGTATIELSPVFRIREPETYRATIRLTGAEFVSPTGARVRQSQPITLTTVVRGPQQ
jgi:hypothetical protein